MYLTDYMQICLPFRNAIKAKHKLLIFLKHMKKAMRRFFWMNYIKNFKYK